MAKKIKSSSSQDFLEKKELIELDFKAKMEVENFKRESDRIHHDNELTRLRIKSAEIRKSMEMKELMRMR